MFILEVYKEILDASVNILVSPPESCAAIAFIQYR